MNELPWELASVVLRLMGGEEEVFGFELELLADFVSRI